MISTIRAWVSGGKPGAKTISVSQGAKTAPNADMPPRIRITRVRIVFARRALSLADLLAR
jgi:hypothetical protein